MQGIDGVGRPWDGSEPSPGMASRLAVAAITGYQRYISPYKGFRCAHRVLHGGESCSQFIKRLVERKGLLDALKASPKRFRACGLAYRILRAEGDEEVPWYRRGASGSRRSSAPSDDMETLSQIACCLAEGCSTVVLPCSLTG